MFVLSSLELFCCFCFKWFGAVFSLVVVLAKETREKVSKVTRSKSSNRQHERKPCKTHTRHEQSIKTLSLRMKEIKDEQARRPPIKAMRQESGEAMFKAIGNSSESTRF